MNDGLKCSQWIVGESFDGVITVSFSLTRYFNGLSTIQILFHILMPYYSLRDCTIFYKHRNQIYGSSSSVEFTTSARRFAVKAEGETVTPFQSAR